MIWWNFISASVFILFMLDEQKRGMEAEKLSEIWALSHE